MTILVAFLCPLLGGAPVIWYDLSAILLPPDHDLCGILGC